MSCVSLSGLFRPIKNPPKAAKMVVTMGSNPLRRHPNVMISYLEHRNPVQSVLSSCSRLSQRQYDEVPQGFWLLLKCAQIGFWWRPRRSRRLSPYSHLAAPAGRWSFDRADLCSAG